MSHGAVQRSLVLLFFLILISSPAFRRRVVCVWAIFTPTSSRPFLRYRVVPWARLYPHPRVCRFSGGDICTFVSLVCVVRLVSPRSSRRGLRPEITYASSPAQADIYRARDLLCVWPLSCWFGRSVCVGCCRRCCRLSSFCWMCQRRGVALSRISCFALCGVCVVIGHG